MENGPVEIVDLPIKNGGFPSKIMAPPSGSPPRRDQSRGAAPCRRLLKVVLGEAFRLEKKNQENPMKMEGICKYVYIYIYIYIYIPIGSMYGIYANIGDTLMVNVTIWDIYIYMVGGIPTPLKNMKVSWGYSSQYMEK